MTIKYFQSLQIIWRANINNIQIQVNKQERLFLVLLIQMKIKFFFNPQALKNIKPTLQLIYKLISMKQPLPRVYFVYFIKSKNIRFIIDSQTNPIIISLGSQMLNSQSYCSLKQDKQLISILFENTQVFFQNLIGVLQKEDQYGLLFEIKKEVLDKKESKFLKLTFKNNSHFISRIAVQTPKYDLSEMKYHPWICGCLQNERQVQIIVFTDQLLNMMKYLIKLKPPAGTKLQITFNLQNRTYTSRSSDQHCLPNVQGQIKIVANASLLNQFKYQINVSELKTVSQMIRKSKQLKVIISKSFHLIFVFMKEDLFVSHIDMYQWIKDANIDQNGRYGNHALAKIEQQQQQGMRWN